MADLMLPVNLKTPENTGKEPCDCLGKKIAPHDLKKTKQKTKHSMGVREKLTISPSRPPSIQRIFTNLAKVVFKCKTFAFFVTLNYSYY